MMVSISPLNIMEHPVTAKPKPKTSDKYRNFGIALPHERVPVFEERLAQLGLKTLGDLATMFCLSDTIMEALTPVVAAYREQMSQQKTTAQRRNEVVARLKELDDTALDELLAKLKSEESPS